MGNHIVSKNIIVFLNVLTHQNNEIFHTFLEIGMQVILHAANHIVVYDKASAASFLENVENLLAITESIEECRGRTQVLAKTAKEQQVGVDTLKFVHYGTYNFYAIAHFNAHSLLYAGAKSVAALLCRNIIKTICERKSLRISHRLVEFLHTAMNIPEHGVNSLYKFTVQSHTEMQHTMSGRMLRTDVHHIIVVIKNHIFLNLQSSVGQKLIFLCGIGKWFVGHMLGIERILLYRVVILTHGVSHPIFTQINAAHVGMSCKDYPVEIIHLTLINIGNVPKIARRGNHRIHAVSCGTAQIFAFSGRCGIKHVNHAETTLFSPVHTYEILEKVHFLHITQAKKFCLQL